MEPNAQKPQDIVDTTDSLEAVGACRSMKNFLFIVLLLSLLLPQMVFWLDRLGLIEQTASTSVNGLVCPETICTPAAKTEQETIAPLGPLPLAASVNVAEEVEKVTEQAEQDTDRTPAEDEVVLNNQTDTESAETAEQASAESEDQTPLRISCSFAAAVIAICNFLIIAGAILYCLTLLMCLKISLTGRLGGMNHITKAFFISLFLVVIVFPWQRLLPGVLVGAVWLPGELLCGGWGKAQDWVIWKILFYLRFCGLWFLAVWFLFWAQIRTGKWARATLRRLGVAR